MKFVNYIKYIPFGISVVYLLFFILLYLGSTDICGYYSAYYISNGKECSWYMELVWISIDYGSIFYFFPYLMLFSMIIFRVIKYRIYLFYPTLLLVVLDFILAEFFWGCWNPY